jgi:hypothetical protein
VGLFLEWWLHNFWMLLNIIMNMSSRSPNCSWWIVWEINGIWVMLLLVFSTMNRHLQVKQGRETASVHIVTKTNWVTGQPGVGWVLCGQVASGSHQRGRREEVPPVPWRNEGFAIQEVDLLTPSKQGSVNIFTSPLSPMWKCVPAIFVCSATDCPLRWTQLAC